MKLICIDPAKVHLVWPSVSGFIDRATKRCGDWTAEQIRIEVFSGRMLLWVAINDEVQGAVITSLNEDRRRRLVCHVVLCGGRNVRAWLKVMHDTIEKFAKDEKCNFVRVEGRQGWRRMFPDLYQPYIVLEKRLD